MGRAGEPEAAFRWSRKADGALSSDRVEPSLDQLYEQHAHHALVLVGEHPLEAVDLDQGLG